MNDAEVEFLSAQGVVVTDHLNDMWFRFLRGSGYYGSMNDMMYQFWCVDGGSTTDFALNIDFTTEPVVDEVTGLPWDATALAALLAGRPKDMTSGELAIAGEATLNSQGLLTYGSYTNLMLWSEDMTQATWATLTSPNITPTTFQATAQYGIIYQGIPTLDGVMYTISFILSVEEGGQTTDIAINHEGSASGGETYIIPTTTPTRYEVSILGAAGGGDVGVGLADANAADWALMTITDFQVTETPSVMPYVKTEATAVVVPDNFSDTGIGYQWDMGVGGVNMPDLWAALAGAPAQGELQIEYTPYYDSAVMTASRNFVIPNTAYWMYINQLGLVGISDGTTDLAASNIFPVPGTPHKIYAAWGTHPIEGANKMQIGVTDGTTNWVSLVGDFDGSFDPIQFLLCSYKFGLPHILHSIKLLKTPMSGTWAG